MASKLSGTNSRPVSSLDWVNSERAAAYGRVMKTIQDLGDGKLQAREQEVVREAADAMVFSRDSTDEEQAHEALREVYALVDRLVEAERMEPEVAGRLTADVEACGPPMPVAGA